MKTRNNVQKTIKKSLAVVVSLVLISITVNAQEFWKTILENNSINEIALAMIGSDIETSPAPADANSLTDFNAMAIYLEEETEEALELENWMTDENYFSTFMVFETEIENQLELENWMVNETNFDAYSLYFETDTEQVLELNDWMLNTSTFKVTDFRTNDTEEEMKLESWMTNEKQWAIG